jgi:hypothetical protein
MFERLVLIPVALLTPLKQTYFRVIHTLIRTSKNARNKTHRPAVKLVYNRTQRYITG